MNFDFGEKEKVLCEKIKELFDAESVAALGNLEVAWDPWSGRLFNAWSK